MTTNEMAGEKTVGCACCVVAPVDDTVMEPTMAAEARHAAGGTGEVREVHVVVKGGYSPATLHLVRGAPARLVFDRQEASRCSEGLLIEAFGIARTLPAKERTVVEITPEEAGTFAFTCGMRMLRGEIIVS